jgi:hypothetical protein
VTVEGFSEESNSLLKRVLVLNQEIDLTELTYDIKLLKVVRKSNIGSGNIDLTNETVAYHLEIFNINEPEVLYKYRLPMS